MRKFSLLWQSLRQMDEQAAAFNPYYHFANQCFDAIVERHRNDFRKMVATLKKMRGKS